MLDGDDIIINMIISCNINTKNKQKKSQISCKSKVLSVDQTSPQVYFFGYISINIGVLFPQ